MFSHQLISHIVILEKSLDEKGAFLTSLRTLSKVHSVITVMTATSIEATWKTNSKPIASRSKPTRKTNSKSIASLSRENRKKLSELITLVRDAIKPKELFLEISLLEERLGRLLGNAIFDKDSLTGFRCYLVNFSDVYGRYLGSPDVFDKETGVVTLAQSGVELLAAAESLKWFIENLKSNFRNEETLTAKKPKGRLSLLLESGLDFTRFTEKLQALDVIYLELCTLVGVSTSENPLAIVKVESGSLWADILGYPKVIGILESLISGTASYMYRYFTREGKIATIPRKVEAVESILQLRAKLKEAGIDSQPADENLSKSLVIISEELNRLLLGEAKVTINEQMLSVGSKYEEKFLNDSRKLFLPEPSVKV